jgi:ATP-dependent helicase/nuclease subunit A
LSAPSSQDDLLWAFRRNVVIAASAGTGKTHRLTTLYVLSALGLTSRGCASDREAAAPIAPARIVGTTFSRAAALEIRERIEEALASLEEERARPALAEVVRARALRTGARGDLRRLAAETREQLRDARIDTLHGVAAELVRDHAVAFGIPPRFEILEEDEEETLSFGIIDELLAEALASEGPLAAGARALVDVCSGFFRARQEVLGFLNGLADCGLSVSDLQGVDHRAHADALFRKLKEGAELAAVDASKRVLPLAQALAGSLRHARPEALDRSVEAALTALFGMTKPRTPSPGEAELFELRDSLKSGSVTNKKVGHRLVETLRQSHELGEVERGLLALLGKIEERLRREKRASGRLGFGDLLVVAREGLLAHPHAARHARAGHDVLMVDEFQDTSVVQRDLVYLLRGGPDTADHVVPTAREIVPHGLFVVGDRKQSIYAFRGADVDVFEAVLSELGGAPARAALNLPEEDAADASIADFVALRENYRSAPRLLQFVNAFSERDFLRAGGMALGSGEELLPARTDRPGEVVVSASDATPAAAPAGPPLTSASADDASADSGPATGPRTPAAQQQPPADDRPSIILQAERAADLCRALLDRGDFEPRDIAVLVRRRASIPFVELALESRKVPFAIAGRALFETLEARDLAALLRLVVDPRDRASLAHVLRGPLVALSDEALAALCDHRGLKRDLLLTGDKLPRTYGAEATRLADFQTRFRDARPSLLRLPASRALAAMLVAFDLDRVLAAMPRAAERFGNLLRIIELSRHRPEGVVAFSRWLDRQIADERDEAEAVVFSHEDDAVRLTTIHASKGLDFRATVVLDLGVSERPRYPVLRLLPPASSSGAGTHRFTARYRGRRGVAVENPALREDGVRLGAKARQERARLTYVALTRARDALLLVAAPASRADGSAQATLDDLPQPTDLFTRDLGSEPVTRTSSSRPSPAPSAQGSPELPAPLARERRLPVLSIATTPLGVFRGCPRRFRFRFLLGLEEPVDSGQLGLFEVDPERLTRKVEAFEANDDPRTRGRAAHRWLELLPREHFGAAPDPAQVTRFLRAEGANEADLPELVGILADFAGSSYAASLRDADQLLREHELVLVEEDPPITLRGTIDLCAVKGDAVEIVDYKLSRPPSSLEAYRFQLAAYAAMAQAAYPGKRVRAGLAFLHAGAPRADVAHEPIWLIDSNANTKLVTELRGLANGLADCRARDDWPGRELAHCRALHCGFVTACHRTPAPRRGR